MIRFDLTSMITMKFSTGLIRAKLKNPTTINIIEEDKSKLTHRIQYKELKDRCCVKEAQVVER
ncbi:MAG: hypothetical protein QW081_05320, partial [Desulfurococcaceae archaeon]